LTSTAVASPGPDNEDLEQQFRKGLDEASRNQARLNMIVAGRPGAGKSTLLNAIFGEDRAPTGIGASVTTEIRRYARPGLPIAIYDTPGIEIGNDVDKVMHDYLAEIRKNAPSDDRRIQFALYCVGDLRFHKFEEEIVRGLAQELPVFLALTQCPTPNDEGKLELAREIEALRLPIDGERIFLTLAKPLKVAGLTLPAFGLESLVTEMYQVLPEAVARTLASHQRVSLALKQEEAQKIVNQYAVIIAGIALEPIPVVDAVAISTLQFAMLGKITGVMDLEVDIKAVMAAIAGIAGVSLTAQQIARQIWKMIPGIGTVISSAMSATITRQMGRAYITACSRIIERKIGGEPVATDDITTQIIRELRRLWDK
jgi:predicted GTPase